MRIDRAELELGVRMGAGSQGTLWDVHKPERYGFSFRALVYKEFSATTQVSGAALEALTRIRDQLDDQETAVLDAMTVWPAAVVVDGERVCGYVMQAVPDRFRQTIRTIASGTESIPREVQHLFVPDDVTRRNFGEAPDAVERLALCRSMAFVLGFLHAKELIFGDLSYRNEVYALRPRPSVMLLDCDSIRVRGQGSAVPQLNSPGWAAPEGGPQTIESDRYKLGLFVLRCVTPAVNAQNRDPEVAAGVLDRPGMEMLRAAVGPDTDARPSGRAWVEYLDAVIARNGGVRERHEVAPSPPAPPVVASRPSPAHTVAGRALRARTGVAAGVTAGPRPARQPAATAAATRVTAPGWPGPTAAPVTGGAWSAGGLPRAAFATRIAIAVAISVAVFAGGTALGPRYTTPSTVVRPSTTIPPPSPIGFALGESASRAIQDAGRVAGSGWQAVAISTGGSPVAFDGTAERWAVELVPTDATTNRPVPRRTLVATAGGWQEGQRTVTEATAAAALTALPLRSGDALAAAVDAVRDEVVAAGGTSVEVAWRCDPEGRDARACLWEISSPGVPNRRWYVTYDGERRAPPPAWAAR